MFTSYYVGYVALIWEQFHAECPCILYNEIKYYMFKITATYPRSPWVREWHDIIKSKWYELLISFIIANVIAKHIQRPLEIISDTDFNASGKSSLTVSDILKTFFTLGTIPGVKVIRFYGNVSVCVVRIRQSISTSPSNLSIYS